MIEKINSEKTAEVAGLLLKTNLQLFADDLGGGESVVDDTDTADNNPDNEDNNLETGGNGEGGNNPGVAEPGQNPSFKDDPQNKAFAEMRRQAEQAQARAKHADDLIARQYGESHGIYTVEQYEQALKAEQQEAERQRLESAGLPEDVINKLSKLDEILQLEEQRKVAEQQKQFDESMKTQIDELTKEHPDVQVKDIKELMALPIYDQMHDKLLKGYTVLDAYEAANRAELRAKALNQGKQTALNQVNSKSHIRGNGGEGADDVDLTSVPADVMATYRQMFAKELKTGKMKESDFVKHYKKSQ